MKFLKKKNPFAFMAESILHFTTIQLIERLNEEFTWLDVRFLDSVS